MNQIIKTPNSVHYAKEVNEKGAFIKWIPSPNKENKRTKTSNLKIQQIIQKKGFKKQFCFFCGRTEEKLGWKETLTIDHIQPIRENGQDKLNNVQILCSACHKLRHWTELYNNKHMEKFFGGEE